MSEDILVLTAQIVSSHVTKNGVPVKELPELIRGVFDALSNAGTVSPGEESLQPAVPIKKSVFPDYLIGLEDGKKLAMLKRHLQTAYNLTTDQYRTKWGLPPNYPMVAPNYAKTRSLLAKKMGLGRTKPVVKGPKDKAVNRRGKPGTRSE